MNFVAFQTLVYIRLRRLIERSEQQLPGVLRVPSCCSAPSLLSTLPVIVQNIIITANRICCRRPCLEQLLNPEARLSAPHARFTPHSRRLLRRRAILCRLGLRRHALGSGTVRLVTTSHARRIGFRGITDSAALIRGAAAGYAIRRAHASFAHKRSEDWLSATRRCW